MPIATPILVLLAWLYAAPAAAQTTFDALLKGKVCKESSNQQIDCDYKIGRDFHLSIAGVGLADAAITFMKSDFKGAFYGTVGVAHGCAIVKPGAANPNRNPADFAFVSPRNGKVYRDWQSCQSAR